MIALKKLATQITETHEAHYTRRVACKLEFSRSGSLPLKWELTDTSALTTTETWDGFELTYAERAFLQRQQIPPGHMILPQYAVLVNQWKLQRKEWRFVDFLLVKKADLTPVIAFEIDGNSHHERMVFDALRDKEIYEQIGCPVVHIANARLQAKKIFAYVEHWHEKIGSQKQS